MALDTRVLTLAAAEDFVSKSRNSRWDGWTIVTFIRNPRAAMSKDGIYDRNSSTWGYEIRVSPDNNGHYTVKVPVRRK
jgi:hypothetical protein